MTNQAYILEKAGRLDEAHAMYEKAFLYNTSDLKAGRALFMFLRKTDRVNQMPEEMKALLRGTVNPFKQ